jgi:hypothetical protein
VANEYDAGLLGETWTQPSSTSITGKGNNQLQLPMDFVFTMVNQLSPRDSASRLQPWTPLLAGPHL